jgi:hypothetical protein
MKKYKYYSKNDLDKQAVGVVYANDIVEATLLACIKKQLNLSDFYKIFKVEIFENGKSRK